MASKKELQSEQSLVYRTAVRFVKGGLSGLISGAILQPLQGVKTSMEVKPIDAAEFLNIKTGKEKINLSFREATSLIYRKEGMQGFLRGLMPACVKTTLNAGVYYSILFYTETYLRMIGFKNDGQINAFSSAFARAVQSVVSNPIVVIKTRLEVVGFNEYSGMMQGAKSIMQKEGFRGFFTGLGISLVRDVPFSGVFYPVYQSFKSFYGMMLSDQRSQAANNALITSLAGWSANIVSCVITNPIDLIRTRVYFQFYNKEET